MITSRFTDSGGARLHFLDSGGSDYGAPIVFVPGMTDIADDYAEVLPLFGRRTVVVELRGWTAVAGWVVGSCRWCAVATEV